MSVSFAVGSNDVRWSQGSAGAVGTGAFSLYALVNIAVGNNNGGFISGYATNTLTRGIAVSSLHLYGPNDFSPAGVGTLTQAVWYEVMVTKPSASALWNMHYRLVNPGGTPGAWTHGTASGGSNQGNGSAITNFRIGNGVTQSNGLIGAWAAWTSELANGTIDLIDGTGLASVAAQSPQEMVALDQWAGTSGDTVLIGTAARTAITGTASVGANPSGFGFTLGGGSTAVTVIDLASGSRLSGGVDVPVSGVVIGDAPARGLLMRSASEAVAFGVSAQDSAGRLLARSADGAGVISGTSWADLPSGLRLRSGLDGGAGSGVAVADVPSALFTRSADGPGVLTGVLIADSPSGSRLGMPPAGLQSGLVVADTPGGLRVGSGASSVIIGSFTSVVVADAPTGLRIGSGLESVSSVVTPTIPIVTPIVVPVTKVRGSSRVARGSYTVYVNKEHN